MKFQSQCLRFTTHAVCVLVLSAGLLVCASGAKRPTDNKSYLVGGGFAYNLRRGYYDIREYRQKIAPVSFALGGFVVGRRYVLNPWVRLQMTMQMNWGSIDTDTDTSVELSNGSIVEELAYTNEYFHFGFSPDLHYAFVSGEPVSPFMLIGVGVNYMRLSERGRINDGGGLLRDPVQIVGGLDDRRFCVDIHGGVGFDLQLTRGLFISAAAVARYWRPVSYQYETDLPLSGVDYWESFRSFGAQLAIVWSAR